MGNKRTGVLKGSANSIVITFTYQGKSCRPRIWGEPTESNLVAAAKFRRRVVDAIEDGTFNMQANFTAMTVDISAQTANKFFTGSNLPINFANGKFQGAGTIGIKSVNSATSTVVGYFAGNQAEGVHGATYQDAAVVGAMAGVFYGSR